MANRKPVVEGNDKTKAPGTKIPLTDLFDWSDKDGSKDIVSFTVKDLKGGGYLTRDGKAQAEGNTHTIPANEIGRWAYVVGPKGSDDTITLKAVDKAKASDSDTARVKAEANSKPDVDGHDQTKAPKTELSLNELFDWSDKDGSKDIASFTVRDDKGGGYLTRDGKAQAEGKTHTIPAGEIGRWEYVFGPAGSEDIVTLKAIDKAEASDSDTARIVSKGNSKPVVEAHDQSTAPKTELSLHALFDWSDKDGPKDIVSFTVKDDKGGGYLTRDGKAQTEGKVHAIPAGEIDRWEYVVGPAGSKDSITFQAVDKAGAVSSIVDAQVEARLAPSLAHDPRSLLLPFNSPLKFTVTQGSQTNDPSHDPGGALQWGIDFGAPTGTRVRAVAAGTIIFAEDNVANGTNGNSNFGNYITMKLDTGLYVTYAHLQKGSVKDENGITWAPGMRVDANEILALSGDTGTVDTRPHPHLHIHMGTRLDDHRGVNDPYWDATVADGAFDTVRPAFFEALGDRTVVTGMSVVGNTPAQIHDWLF